MIMIILLSVLALIVSFGAGFILNMLTKFWLSSAIAFAALFIYIIVKAGFGFGLVEWILLSLVALGAFASAFAIRMLRNQGFRMFQ